MTLLEVLLSMLILAGGVFGASGLQLRALQATEHARRETQAVWLAHGLLEQARAGGTLSTKQRSDWHEQVRSVLGHGARGEINDSGDWLQVQLSWLPGLDDVQSVIGLQGRVAP